MNASPPLGSERDFGEARLAMVETQLRSRGMRDPRVLAVMAEVPRERFVAPEAARWAYDDRPLPTRDGQTISQPWIVARMLELAELHEGHRVLEVGTGSGYQTMLLARLVREVVSVESNHSLAEDAARRLRELGVRNVRVHCGDGSIGWRAEGPYARVLAAAAAPHVPEAFFEQLEADGVVVLPVGSRDVQRLEVWRHIAGRRTRELHETCRFVPLIGREAWPGSP